MNKAEVVAKVSSLSGVEPETCEKVLKGLQKVLQDELGSSGRLGAMTKIMEIVKVLRKED